MTTGDRIGDVLHENPRAVPVACEVDLCVLGGSCTGVFAAVAAARLGLRVALVEMQGFFGGVASAGLVNVWHSLLSTDGKQTTIAGLTREVIDRLARRNAVTLRDPLVWHGSFWLNTEVLKIVLDELVVEAGVRPFLHARFCAPHVTGGRPAAAVIEDKSGRRAIAARYFVDATGDGDFVHRCGLPTRTPPHVQPPTACVVLRGLAAAAPRHPEYAAPAFPGLNLARIVFDPRFPEALRPGMAWWDQICGSTDETMLAGTRVFDANCCDADQLTQAEIEGRRQAARIVDLLRTHFLGGQGQPLVALPAHIGVRETRHAVCRHRLTQDELLTGVRFDDAVANGVYPVDIHHHDREGITFRYLDGREVVSERGSRREGRWLPDGATPATFYQIPYRCLVPQGATNVLVAGRCVDADEGAFGGVRVMVNCNQTGEAAGTACALAARENGTVADVPAVTLRATLRAQGAAVL